MSGGAGIDASGLAIRLGTADWPVLIEAARFRCGPGRIALLDAPSGAGKSTLLALLGCALAPQNGAGRAPRLVLRGLDGRMTDAAALWLARSIRWLDRLRAQTIGFLPQTGGLAPFFTLRDNILAPLRLAGRKQPGKAVEALAARLGISAILDRKPEAVSIGQRQRAAFARALIGEPAILIIDEPTAALDRGAAAGGARRRYAGMAGGAAARRRAGTGIRRLRDRRHRARRSQRPAADHGAAGNARCHRDLP